MRDESLTRPEQVDFAGLQIRFDHRVLRPRPWTAAQSHWAAELASHAPAGPVLELCTGAGHLGLLAARDTGRRLVAVDASPVAVGFARANAAVAGLADRVDVREGQLDQVLGPDEEFVVILADPPWVQSAQVTLFPDDPVPSIDGGPDGLDLVWRCLSVIERHLVAAGSAILQVGTPAQAGQVDTWLRAAGRLTVVQCRDFPGRGTLIRIDATGARAL